MKETIPTHIYPQIETIREGNTLHLKTWLRKKHYGKYYYWKFERHAYVPKESNNFTAAFSSFTRDIYIAQMYGKINPKQTYGDTTKKVFPLAGEQKLTEKERMNPTRRFDIPIK